MTLGVPQVDLDSFLEIMLRAWEAEAALLRKRWAEVFFMVDADGNNTLDLDEFKTVGGAVLWWRTPRCWCLWLPMQRVVQAMSMIDGVQLPEARMQSIFLETIGHGGEDFLTLEQFIDIVQRNNFHFTNIGASDGESDAGTHAALSDVASVSDSDGDSASDGHASEAPAGLQQLMSEFVPRCVLPPTFADQA